MDPQELADLLHISVEEVNHLLSLSPQAIYQDPLYRTLVQHMNSKRLHQSAPQARAAYNHSLDAVKEKYGLAGTVMSGYTLVNWVLGFLMMPERMVDMLERHSSVDRDVIANALPELVDILGDMGDGREDWQHALVVFSLPLIVQGQ